jgi:flavin reductase (DIM6/NTAB) family NADH-FMN oxidoreductase RutF
VSADNVDPDEFKAALGSWPAVVTIVTTRDDGNVYGLTVSSFSSLSFDPLMILVCVNNTNHFLDMARKSGVFAVSILSQGQDAISNAFAASGRDPVDSYAEFGVAELSTGCPVFNGAAAHLDCELEQAVPAGDHTIFIGRVVDVRANPDLDPLIYYRRAYRAAV